MDNYQRIRILGRGTYGVATLVREASGQLHVAKEVILKGMAHDRQRETHQEAELLKSLSHVNIIAYHAAFIEHEVLSIIMEYADGGDLSTALRHRTREGQRFAEAEALSILGQCAQALKYIHDKHIVHRDLKGENVFLTSEGLVKLGDFGVAKVLQHPDAFAHTLIGTPSNLPPEVCNNYPYSMKADIWSLGVIMYEVLTLETPFHAENVAVLMVKITSVDPKPLPTDEYSEEVCSVVWQMLQKEPTERPTAAEILDSPAAQKKVRTAPLAPPMRPATVGQTLLPLIENLDASQTVRSRSKGHANDALDEFMLQEELASSCDGSPEPTSPSLVDILSANLASRPQTQLPRSRETTLATSAEVQPEDCTFSTPLTRCALEQTQREVRSQDVAGGADGPLRRGRLNSRRNTDGGSPQRGLGPSIHGAALAVLVPSRLGGRRLSETLPMRLDSVHQPNSAGRNPPPPVTNRVRHSGSKEPSQSAEVSVSEESSDYPRLLGRTVPQRGVLTTYLQQLQLGNVPQEVMIRARQGAAAYGSEGQPAASAQRRGVSSNSHVASNRQARRRPLGRAGDPMISKGGRQQRRFANSPSKRRSPLCVVGQNIAAASESASRV